MRIEFEQTGGFMGRTIDLILELSELPAEQADEIRHLLDAADFFNLDQEFPPQPARDEFWYRVTVETNLVKHTVRASDANAPPALRPLLQDLSQRARSQRG